MSAGGGSMSLGPVGDLGADDWLEFVGASPRVRVLPMELCAGEVTQILGGVTAG